MARIIENYYADYSDAMDLVCPKCGWAGIAENAPMEMYKDLFDRSCPSCWEMLLIVPYPTSEQTREAAAAGNTAAVSNCKAYGIEY